MRYIITLSCFFVFNSVFAQTTDSILTEGPKEPDAAGSYLNPDSIYAKVDIQAGYPGGIMAWNRYLNNNFKYPKAAKKAKVQGDVSVRFVVETDGKTHNFEIMSGPDELREESLDLVRQSGNWTPAIQNGKKVRSYKIEIFYYRLNTSAPSSENLDSIRSYSASDSVYVNPEIPAAYPGGSFAWNRYLERNLYPENEAGTQGMVVVKFIVEKNGSLNSFEVISGIEKLQREAINVIKKSGIWVPGIQDGKKVRSYCTQAIYLIPD